MNKYLLFILLSFILSACSVLAPEPTATITLTPAPTFTPTLSLTPTPSPNPYLVGRDSEGNIVVNHLDLSNVIRTGVVPENQFVIEQAYIENHPEITGAGNSVADEVLGSEYLPYKTLHTTVQRDNVLCINIDDATGNIEIVYLQEDPTNHVIASVHVVISAEAQAAWLAALLEIYSTTMAEQYLLSYGDNLERFNSGESQSLELYIFMDSPANSNLIPDPTFAEIQDMVTQAGNNTFDLVRFTTANVYTPEESRTSATTVSQIVFASSNVRISQEP